ncbi:MAG: hypothetical protein ABFS46_11170, partial [Myxococcota bacterium]
MVQARRAARLVALLPAAVALLGAAPGAEESAGCSDPRLEVGSAPLAVREALASACPVCPHTARARYTRRSDYVRCVQRVVHDAQRRGDLRRGAIGTLLSRSLEIPAGRGEGARTLLPGPGENGYDPGLAGLARQYDRQFFTFHAAPFSMSLDVHVDPADPSALEDIERFLADPEGGFGADAFRQQSGREVFDVVDHYGEIGDLGMFGGVAAAGDAHRYAVLRDGCARRREGCELLDDARERLAEILEVLHVAHAITGEHGVVARGLFRRGMPQRGGDPATVPLFDAVGGPNPRCRQKPEDPTCASFDQRPR